MIRDIATEEEVRRARRMYAEDSDAGVEIDDVTGVSVADNGVWVAAWVWLPNEEESSP